MKDYTIATAWTKLTTAILISLVQTRKTSTQINRKATMSKTPNFIVL